MTQMMLIWLRILRLTRHPEARRAQRPVDDTNDVTLLIWFRNSETDQASGSTAGAEAGR